ncbi:MAG: thymidylate synthase [Anaerocolumna sp.]|jgi:thymidylate synthase (FAD)|nr:thymidylate synthase [Anaerocolumna sp.]
MNIIKASYSIIDELKGHDILKKIELCGRVCYKSEEKITVSSAEKFIVNIINRGHESVLEHVSFSVRFIVDRGISHEIVRHRIASFSQESTRYCNYGKADEITVIEPLFWESTDEEYDKWKRSCEVAEYNYISLLNDGATPQEARSVLPNSLKTDIIMTANIREWRHFLRLRTSQAAHPQIREVTVPLLMELYEVMPVIFEDIVKLLK